MRHLARSLTVLRAVSNVVVVGSVVGVAIVGGGCATDGNDVSFVDRRAEIHGVGVDPFPGVDSSGDIDLPISPRTPSLAPERRRFIDEASARLDVVAARLDVFREDVKNSELAGDIRDDALKAAADLGAEVVAARNHVHDDVTAATDVTWGDVHDGLDQKVSTLEQRLDVLETQLHAR